uniref:Double-stranded RNA binding motif-containing protein n=1 Tax=Marseillevirus LCMAC102 TaxID=2506603 RepID=A0A481YT64_9VIRU|nr:MAG: double-stranded RNA binding motif-containing protein [Marseillevirus LCMAC102]
MFSKNKLQEFFQKNNLPLPEYITSRIGGNAHDPVWVTDVELYNGSLYKGDPQATKKKAELSAATIALSQIHNIECLQNKPLHNFLFKKSIKIFVDIENKPNFIKVFVNKVASENIEIYGFVSKGHPQCLQYSELNDIRFHLFPIPSTRKDGADIGLIMHVGIILQKQSTDTVYIIVSNDHFADALVDCIKIYKKEACVCRSFKDVIATLTEFY